MSWSLPHVVRMPPSLPLVWGGPPWQRVGGATEDARDLMRQIDSYAQYFPVTAAALGLQKSIFEWASAFGIKDQVEYVVYALRAASGVEPQAAAAGAAASAQLAAQLYSAGVLSAVLPVAGAVAAIATFFSGGDDEAETARQKQVQAGVQHLKARLSLADFASEQRDAATLARVTAASPVLAQMMGGSEPEKLQKDAQVADGLANLYDKARKELPANQRALFESISNLARWRGALDSYASLSQSQKDNFDAVGFGTTQPRLTWQLKPLIDAEAAKVNALASVKDSDSSVSLLLALTGLALAGGVAAVYPAQALSIAKMGASGAYKVGGAAFTGGKYAYKAGSSLVKRFT